MINNSIRTLLIEDNPADARALSEALAEVPEAAFELEWADGLCKGLQKLESGPVDLVLLDLCLPESRGLATFATTQACAPSVPIIVLTGLDDGELAMKAVRNGAQDYLVKGQLEGISLVRSMQHAVVRHRIQGETEGLYWKDALTGLYNRQGFLVLGEQFLRFADQTARPLAVVLADVDGLKQISEKFGIKEGDTALQRVAEALSEAFKQSNLIARVGGDEFASMCLGSSGWPRWDFKTTFEQAVRPRSPEERRPYSLTVTWGLSVYDPAKPRSLAELLKLAAAQGRPKTLAPGAEGEARG
jgi:diguanylate cyclase (GGDEF)-like protein